ncbi:MAG: PAS domain-containing sensor histidine kinase [Actinomycetota bacterium]|nr:MAG: PAS/PAC sensor signal transduction histidine [Actinomycetota bacterium]MDO8950582.1 PAS domain-containing sensor histidine kinase [Actinomycetota bacterium]MDP3629559.1 PAS domain-containing sensor histidine kinase [Actinomycetota bacterium]
MSQVLIVGFDIISLVAFTAALVGVLLIPFDHYGSYSKIVRLFLALAIAVYVFAGVSNILEHAGITAALDPYEDYGEIFFVPFVAYALFTMNTALRENEIRRSSELVRAEHELLNTIVETNPSGIMLVAASGEIAFANDRAKALLGISSDEAAGTLRLPADFICTSTVSASIRPLDLGLLATGESFDSALCVIEANGQRAALAVSASPLALSEGGRQGSVVAFVDVTEREQARQDLLDAQARYSLDLEHTVDERTVDLFALNRELDRANQAKQEFLARANHELRTPLSAIAGFAGALLSEEPGPVNAEQRAQIGMMKESSEQLLALVNGLLDIGRVESGLAVVEPVETDLTVLLTDIADLVRPLAGGRGVSLTLAVAPEMVLQTDPDLLGQIVRNLLSNAIKFTDAGGTVTLSASVDRGVVRIAVTDTGIGIEADEQEHIFEPFIQLASAQSGRPKGSGLGLAICRDLAAALGGSVDLVSGVGAGSTFTVELPLENVGEQA